MGVVGYVIEAGGSWSQCVGAKMGGFGDYVQLCCGTEVRGIGVGPVTAEEPVGEVEGCFYVAGRGGGPEIHGFGSRVRFAGRGEEVPVAGSECGSQSEGGQGAGVHGGGS